jgi:hypothetical protein
MLEGIVSIEKEINDLIAISKEKTISLTKNDLDWGKPILKAKVSEDSITIKLYKIYYIKLY